VTAAVKSFLVPSVRDLRPVPPGAIEPRRIDDEWVGLAFGCPCGCGLESWLNFTDPDHPQLGGWGPRPAKDADMTRLTLTPSILQTFPCRWHGFLTDGEFRQV